MNRAATLPKADPVHAAHRERLRRYGEQLRDRANARRIDASKLAERAASAGVTNLSALIEKAMQSVEAAQRLDAQADLIECIADGSAAKVAKLLDGEGGEALASH